MSLNYSYEYVKEEFAKHGFLLTSTEYNNCKEKLECIDKQGYKLFTSLDNITKRNKSNASTRRFHGSNPYTIENINHYITINGLTSKCVDDKYVNSRTLLKFQCECGETFYTDWNTFHTGKKIKCDKCSRNPFADKDYNSVKQTLETFGYYLEVDENAYLGVTLTPLICHDKFGYKYKLTYDAVLRGKRPSPVSKSNQFSIYNINVYLKNNNKDFTCISNEFIDRNHLLEFVCNRCNEIIFAKWTNMYKCDKGNSNRSILTCPNCDGRCESVHALVLKQMFKHYYPDTIEEEKSCVNPLTGCILPTDIVNHRLKIAVEIQSEWHDREYQKIKDKIKKEFWINKGYKFYDPDIRDYSVLGMCKIFFDISELPDYINYEYSNKLNIKKAQELLDKDLSPRAVAEILNTNIHVIYDAIGYGKLHYSDTYVSSDKTAVVQLDNNLNYVAEFDTIKNAKNSTGCKNISGALKSKTHYSGGYYWVSKTDYYNNTYSIQKSRNSKFNIPVDQYSKNGEFIASYNTIFEASKKYNCTNYSILEVMNNKRKSLYGYVWKYKK